MANEVLLHETFEGIEDGGQPSDDWWLEGGVWMRVEGGRLRTNADPAGGEAGTGVATAWNKTPVSGDLKVSFDAHVLSSSVNVNNINFFLMYADPSGEPLYETRERRDSGGYDLYHPLNGYIFTFLNADPDNQGRARFRMRRCPGFNLMTETFDYHCREGVTYHAEITKRGGKITFAVDGKVYLEHEDPEPWTEGIIGLRTFKTDLWWGDIRVERND